MASLSSSPPYSSEVPRLGGITIQLPPSLRENLIKGRQRILQQQEQDAEKTAVLHTLTNTTVRTSLAAIQLAAAASSSAGSRFRDINAGSEGIIPWREKEEEEEDEVESHEEEVDEYRLQFEKEFDEAIVSALPFHNSSPESSDDEYTEEKTLGSVSSNFSDDESLSPPPSLPLLIISLEKLCGYIPQTLEDYLLQKKHVEEALYGITGEDNKTEDNVLSSIHFSNHASELFELGIAIHSDTIQTCNNSSTATNDSVIVPYPEYILMNTNYGCGSSSTSDGHQLLKVSTMWKYILRSHPIPVVERLLTYLRRCNRDIQWKYYMTHYIRKDIVRNEISIQDKKRKLLLMQEFKQRRANELEKLYETRDVFERLIEETLDKQHELEWQRRQSGTGDLASETFDFLVQQQKGSQQKNQVDSSSYNSKEEKKDKPVHFPSENNVKSIDEVNTETLVRAWNQRLAKIDALIESMQDDQWAEEEEQEEVVANTTTFEAEEANADHLSLLDQILAMIMGKITPPSNSSDDIMEEHVQNIFTMHHTIVREWKDYFGRLPPPAATEVVRESSEIFQSNDGNTSVASLKSRAVNENDNLVTVLEGLSVDHWEDLLEEPDNDIGKSLQENSSRVDAEKHIRKHGGLRPGGKV